MSMKHISVCICTYKRPFYLKRLLDKLEHQRTGNSFTFGIVVVDNDEGRSAEIVVDYFARRLSLDTVYCCEPRQNIALARNKAVQQENGEMIAFIDDDEFPADDWLFKLVQTCETCNASGVLGPVRPHFDRSPPNWILKGRFCERPEYSTGTVMNWSGCRTGNLLIRREIIKAVPGPFNPEFGTGGEDIDFFMRMTERGCRFVWCNEAIVYEIVPPTRWSRSYMLHRALLRGKNALKRSNGRGKLIVKSALAAPLYLLIMPGALLSGQHVFMKYGIKFCDHLGRLLALVGLNPINERQM